MLAFILAGGSGTRFWPLSRGDRPKQLVRLWGEETMIEATASRLKPHVGDDGVFVVCGSDLVEPIDRELEIGGEHFVVEPAARNTLPAIALAALEVMDRSDDEPFGIFPADHFIGDTDAFRSCLAEAEAAARDGHIATIGIGPTRPETGYGYIHFEGDDDAALGATAGGPSPRPVRAFVEKPDREVAERYLRSGDYLWNAGMFVMTPSTLFEEMERQLPEMYEAMMELKAAYGSEDYPELLAETFEELQSISIDYGIMENAEDVVVVPANFRWSDVGHWGALEEVRPTDPEGNVVDADALLDNVSESVIFSEGTGRLIAGIDLDDMVVVDTDDAVLVMPKSSAQKVRDVVDRLRDEERDDVL